MSIISKLNLDEGKIEQARQSARAIADTVQDFVDQHTTTTVERAVARLFGIDGISQDETPLPNIVVEDVHREGKLDRGIAYWLGNAMLYYRKSSQEIAEQVMRREIKLIELPAQPLHQIKAIVSEIAHRMLARIKVVREERENLIEKLPPGPRPYLYAIVATGNIYEDVAQAESAASQGANIIAVIRTTGQSLLDHVPYGPTTEGFGGTYATQANFKIMRRTLDQIGEKLGRYIQLVNYCSGLCMPEIAVMGAIERLDMMLNDSMYGILFRDINMKRTFIDQYFSRMINAFAGIVINTGEDNYLTTSDAYTEAHTVLASQFINEQLALLSGLREEQMGLGHAFEMDPNMEDGLLYEIAQAQMAREIFPNAPLKYMPPTKYKSGNIFDSHTLDTMFNLVSVLTNQGIHLVGMLTEAIHTPFMHDRALSVRNAKYVMNNARNLGSEITFRPDGKIAKRAQEVLNNGCKLLLKVKEETIWSAISRGVFADVKRSTTGGRGFDGVVKRDRNYYNPFMEIMSAESK